MNRRLVGLALIAAAIGACVIAEPPADLPTLPAQPPVIERASVVPSPNAVLVRWPDKFIVPVRLADARSTIQYATFVDYNPATGDGFQLEQSSNFDLTTTQGSTRIIEAPITEPADNGCHTVEVVVAFQLGGGLGGDNIGAHTPGAGGGDSVTWFYSPSGDLAGCPVLDAGLLPDAQALESIDGSSP